MELSPIVTELLRVLELGIHMRALQRDFLQTRNLKTLREMRQAERDFDKQAKAALDGVTHAAVQGQLLP